MGQKMSDFSIFRRTNFRHFQKNLSLLSFCPYLKKQRFEFSEKSIHRDWLLEEFYQKIIRKFTVLQGSDSSYDFVLFWWVEIDRTTTLLYSSNIIRYIVQFSEFHIIVYVAGEMYNFEVHFQFLWVTHRCLFNSFGN